MNIILDSISYLLAGFAIILIVCLGVIMPLYAGIYILIEQKIRKNRYTMEVMGKVIEVGESVDDELYFPTVEFFDGKKLIRKKYLSGTSKKCMVGDEIKIYCNPNKLNNFCLEKIKDKKIQKSDLLSSFCFIMTGLIFLIVFIFLLF